MSGDGRLRGEDHDNQEPPASVPHEELTAETKAAVLAMHAASLAAATPPSGDEDRDVPAWESAARLRDWEHRRTLMLWLILLVIASLGVGAVVVARTFLGGAATVVDVTDPSAPMGAATAGTNPESQAAGLGFDPACLIPADAVVLGVKAASTEQGKADPAMFVTTWELAVRNTTDAAVTVSGRWAGSGSGTVLEGWTGVGLIVEPGQEYVFPINMIDNNQSGRSGELEWNYVDRVLVLTDTPQCAALHGEPTAELEQAALVSPSPGLPAGVAMPATP